MKYEQQELDRLLEAVAGYAQAEEALAMLDKAPDQLSQEAAAAIHAEGALPPTFRRGLHALLNGIRETNGRSLSTGILMDTALSPEAVTLAEEQEDDRPKSPSSSFHEPELGDVGIACRDGGFSIAPYWVQSDGQGSIALPVASVDVKEEHTFDFRDAGYPGAVSCELQLETEYEGEGLLRFRWSADHVPAQGWWVAVYRLHEPEPCFDELLGNEAKGEVVFPAPLLGFDPVKTPFRYVLYPR